MATSAWSCRVMSGRGGNRSETFTVPAGRRLVILHVFVGQWDPAQSSFRLDVHGIAAWYLPLTTGPKSFDTATRLTAYAGETVKAWCFGPDMSYAVDGYLLQDSATRPDDADNVITPIVLKPGPEPEPLPA